jgi:prepilin-type N-terminal cleavage/methylation domain-containing protein
MDKRSGRQHGKQLAAGSSRRRGMTLLELMLAIVVFLVAAGTLVMVLTRSRAQAAFLGELQLALNAVHSELEAIQAEHFDLMAGNRERAVDLQGQGRLPPNTPPIMLSVSIRSADDSTAEPDLVDVHVAACWRSMGRDIGEDRSPCNGRTDPGEDTNGNGWLDSPAMASVRLARRRS